MNTIETAMCRGINFLLDNRERLKQSLPETEIRNMNEVLRAMAGALDGSIDSGKPFAGNFMSHREFMKKGIQV